MADSPQVQRLKRRLNAIPKAVREATAPGIVAAAEELAALMKRLAPKDTGDLAESIEVTPPGQPTPAYSQPGGSRVANENEAIVSVGNSKVRYGHLPEYGTAHAPAQPYFWPSVRLLRKKLQRKIKARLRKAVREGWNKP